MTEIPDAAAVRPEPEEMPAAVVRELLGTMEFTMGRLAGVNYAQATSDLQMEVIESLRRLATLQSAVDARSLWAFDRTSGYEDFGFGGAAAAVAARCKITSAAARKLAGLRKRLDRHPVIVDAVQDLVVSESWAEHICSWPDKDKVDEEFLDEIDTILMAAAGAGLDLPDLRALYEEIRDQISPPDQDGPEEPDRSLSYSTTMGGAGILRGNLSAECAALMSAILEPLARKAGPEDDRPRPVRLHDALHKVMELAAGAKEMPQSNGQPTTANVMINFMDLRQWHGASVIEQQWLNQAHAQWRGQQHAAGLHGGAGHSSWLVGDDAQAIACDAMIRPAVTGNLNTAAVDVIIEVAAELKHLMDQRKSIAAAAAEQAAAAAGQAAAGQATAGAGGQAAGTGTPQKAGADLDRRIKDLFFKLASASVDLVSGPGGLASVLRTGLFEGTAVGGKSMVLDCGHTKNIPPHIRTALNGRYPVCAFPGCDRPAWQCEPHHVVWLSRKGRTMLKNLVNLCYFHHHILIHKMGWSLTVDGTGQVTFRKPDGTIHDPATGPPRHGP